MVHVVALRSMSLAQKRVLYSSTNALQVKASNRADAYDLCNSICGLFLSKQAKYDDSQRYEKLRFDMIVAAITGGIPSNPCANVSHCPNKNSTYCICIMHTLHNLHDTWCMPGQHHDMHSKLLTPCNLCFA